MSEKESSRKSNSSHLRRFYQKHFERWRQSQLSQKEYCRQNEIILHRFTYNWLGQQESVIHMGCLAHCRRKFAEVVKARKKIRGKHANAKTMADKALDYIGKLYLIKRRAREQEMTVGGP
jgi:hypothetical protein